MSQMNYQSEDIGKRVLDAFAAAWQQRDFEKAAQLICPAMEATARKKLSSKVVNRDGFKRFLREYYWLFQRFGGLPFDLNLTRFPDLDLSDVGGGVVQNPDLADVIYHVFRCSTAHGHPLKPRFSFEPTSSNGDSYMLIHMDGERLVLPEATLWGMIALTVFCDANADIASRSVFWFTYPRGPNLEPYRMDLDIFWGKEAAVREFFERFPPIRLNMQMRTESK